RGLANNLSAEAVRKKERGVALRSTPRSYSTQILRLALQPIVDILAHHILSQAIALLDDPFELLALSVDQSQIVIGEFTPFLFDPALSLFPISFDAVPVHSRDLRKIRVPLARGNVATCRTVPI